MDSRDPAFQVRVAPVADNELPALLTRGILEACPTPMILFENRGSDCIVRYVNTAFARRTGYSTAEIARIRWDGIHLDCGRERGPAHLRAAISEQREFEMPLRIHAKNGVTFSAALHVSPLPDQGTSTPSYAVGVLTDATTDIEYVRRLEREAHYDPLTGLPNRRLLAESAKRAIVDATRENQLLGAALIDLDDFKLINDTLGHAAGDEVLCAVGARLARDIRPGDLIARIGGDEFVLLLREANGFFFLASVIERVRRRIEQPIHLRGQSITISCSIGVSVCPMDGADLNALLKQADTAMYRQKTRRRSMRAGERDALCQPAPAHSAFAAAPCSGNQLVGPIDAG